MPLTVDQMVTREVNCCLSALVSTLAAGSGFLVADRGGGTGGGDLSSLCEQALELSAPIDDWEEAAIQEGWQWDEGGPHFYRNVPGASTLEPYQYAHIASGDWRELCDAEGIDPYQREVFEHWSVSPWLARQLEAKGERVDMDFAGLNVWARTTSGQGIASDSVILAIYNEMMAPAPAGRE